PWNGLTALSKIGGSQSSALFLDKAKALNYQYDTTNASSLAIDYAKQLAKTDEAAASKFATTLFNNAGKAKGSAVQVGALEVLTDINPQKQRSEERRVGKEGR